MSEAPDESLEIRAQAGPQEDFLSTEADIAFYGGAAGGGKSYGLVIEPLRHLENQNFRGVLFRRETPMITNPGGLFDETAKVYTLFGASPVRYDWAFPSGAEIKLSHMFEENDKYSWQGAQLSFIGWDEVTHFSQDQFFYLLSRLRSMSGVPGYVRATCNPDPDSWVAEFISWWLDQETGFPIPERAGVLRYFIREGENFIWADSKEELIAEHGSTNMPKSVTFIPAKVQDNKILLDRDPTYIGNLMALNRVDRGRLLDGNWKVKASSGAYFKREWFEILDSLPPGWKSVCRYWDRAATEPSEANPNPDWSAGLLLYAYPDGTSVVADVRRARKKPLAIEDLVKTTAHQDTPRVRVCVEQDPGSSGVADADNYVRLLKGFDVRVRRPSVDKLTRAKPASAQAERGNIKILRAAWNDAFLNELESFPPKAGARKRIKEKGEGHDDQVDVLSGAYNELCEGSSILDVL